MFESIPGNNRVKNYLLKMVEKDAIGQSLLFAGPESAHMDLFAKELANHILGENRGQHHQDLHIYQPEGKIGMHSIESMRRFSEEVYLTPMQANKKLFLLTDAERMLPTSSNALLKTFEEPAPHSIIILISHNAAALLPTILSRCRIIRFEPTITTQNSNSKMVALFTHPPFRTWNDLSRAAADIADSIKAKQDTLRTELQEEIMPKDLELTATQKQAIEKEVEGTLSMRLIQEAQELLQATLSWFRDLELIHTGGSIERLLNLQLREQLVHAYERNERIPLDRVERTINDAQTSLNRSTPLQNILETLLIQLKRL